MFSIANQPFVIKPWKLFVEANIDNINIITIQKVVKNYRDYEDLSQLESSIGTSLSIDKLIKQLERITCARICVEVDTLYTYPKSVSVVLGQSMPLLSQLNATRSLLCIQLAMCLDVMTANIKVQSNKKVFLW